MDDFPFCEFTYYSLAATKRALKCKAYNATGMLHSKSMFDKMVGRCVCEWWGEFSFHTL